MNKKDYNLLDSYMLSCMDDSAHDKEHVYRVLYNAMDIAKYESNVDYDILISACLLHDIGRKEQFENPDLCHAMVGAEKAYKFLIQNGFEVEFAEQVKVCIQAHRYRKNNLPQSIEAKILFDADKLDVTGAMGIARTLIYKGIVSEPLYNVGTDGTILDGTQDKKPSFFQEYKYKLEKIYANFYTVRGLEIAGERQMAAVRFYEELLREVKDTYQNGKEELLKKISK